MAFFKNKQIDKQIIETPMVPDSTDCNKDDTGMFEDEAQESLEAAERAGDLLSQLHHPQIPFGLVVVEGHGEVAHEGKDAVVVVAEAVEQIAGLALLASTSPFRTMYRSDRILRVAGLDDPLVTLEEPILVCWRQCAQAGRAGRFDGLLDAQQVIDHLLGPLLILLLPQEDEFAQQMFGRLDTFFRRLDHLGNQC